MQSVKTNRNLYIGGSDIPTLMGINPFKTRYDLLLEKAGLQENEFVGNEYTEYGQKMEDKIRDYINSQGLSKKAYKEDKKIVGNRRAHVDGYNGESLLEIKTTSQIKDGLDDYKLYLVQLLFYMEIMGVSKGCLAVYERPADFDLTFDEKKLKIFYLDISNYKELLEQINNAINQFELDLSRLKENPLLTEEDLMPMDLTTLSNEIIALENKLAEIKPVQEKIEALKEQLVQGMVSAEIKKWETPNGTKITLVDGKEASEEVIKVFNEDNFKTENEKLYNKYLEDKVKKTSGRKAYVKITLPKGE